MPYPTTFTAPWQSPAMPWRFSVPKGVNRLSVTESRLTPCCVALWGGIVLGRGVPYNKESSTPLHNQVPIMPTIRFDQKEIAIIFSLFIFSSLLMFTVGIVVGKGISQARYEQAILSRPLVVGHPSGTSISDNQVRDPATASPASQSTKVDLDAEVESPPLEIIPKNSVAERTTLTEPSATATSRALMDNPTVRSVIENPPAQKEAKGRVPQSFPSGDYTVQVGSYPSRKEALDRITALKKIGFPHAYLSEKQFGRGKETWYRVWLGRYPDQNSAQTSGEMLQQRGEVKNFLVRKSDRSG